MRNKHPVDHILSQNCLSGTCDCFNTGTFYSSALPAEHGKKIQYSEQRDVTPPRVLQMGSNPASDALIVWNLCTDQTVRKTREDPQPEGRWALILNSVLHPHPGCTLDRIYTSWGRALEAQANHIAYSLGLGPLAMTQKIKCYFGEGEQRALQLEQLRKAGAPKLGKQCSKLMGYSLPTESANTQCRTFKDIVELATLFPGLRMYLLHAKCMEKATSLNLILALWCRLTGPPDEEWSFWQTLAAVCLSDTTISTILEESSIAHLTSSKKESLSVIERLLVEHSCSALCRRYLGGILDLPGFWLEMGNLHSDIVRKLCCQMVLVLKDIGVDIQTQEPIIEEFDSPFDYEGVDFLATRILIGISTWFTKLGDKDWALQSYYESFHKFLQLLRGLRSEELLPNSFTHATTTFQDIPTIYQEIEFNVFVDAEDRVPENEMADHDHHMMDWKQCITSTGNNTVEQQDEPTLGPGALHEDGHDSQRWIPEMVSQEAQGQSEGQEFEMDVVEGERQNRDDIIPRHMGTNNTLETLRTSKAPLTDETGHDHQSMESNYETDSRSVGPSIVEQQDHHMQSRGSIKEARDVQSQNSEVNPVESPAYRQLMKHPSHLQADSVALDLLPEAISLGLSDYYHPHQIMRAGLKVKDEVATAISFGHPEKAVEWLEQCRGQFFNLRTQVKALGQEYPELANELSQLSAQLEGSTRDQDRSPFPRKQQSLELAGQQANVDAHKREVLLSKIRELDGFEQFLLPKTISELSSVAQVGPVVVLYVSKFSCDGLGLLPGLTNEVIHIPFPQLTPAHVETLTHSLETLLMSLSHGQLNSRRFKSHSEGYAAGLEDDFAEILSELWVRLVWPVLDALAITTPTKDNLQRIWWCPTGPLTLLPIHAAGLYGDNDAFGSKLSDFVISSYTPSLAALIQGFRSTSRSDQVFQLLAVAPSAVGQSDIPGTKDEITRIQRCARGKMSVCSLVEDEANLARVEEGMMNSGWVHFACHGIQDLDTPTNSALLLAGSSRLTLERITKLSLPHADFAFLSACQTATGDKTLEEESIHLAAGMLLAGYRSVIATMWSIRDNDASEVAGDVYEHLFKTSPPDPTRAAEALHLAVRNLREGSGGKLSFLRWVPFIHLGV